MNSLSPGRSETQMPETTRRRDDDDKEADDSGNFEPSSDKHERLRKRIAEALRAKLLQSHADDEHAKVTAHSMSERLASLLVSRSVSIKDKAQPCHLQGSIQDVVCALQRRRRQKKLGASSRPEEKLRRKMLGAEKYAKAKRLVDEIKMERLRVVGSSCPQCQRLENGLTMCPRPSKEFPPAVKKLFFSVDLIHTLEFRSPQGWQNVNWDQLIMEAEEILREYKAWSRMS